MEKLIGFMEKFSVKKFIAIIVSVAFVILSLMGKISSDNFMNVVLMIFTFYFTQSIANNNNKQVNRFIFRYFLLNKNIQRGNGSNVESRRKER